MPVIGTELSRNRVTNPRARTPNLAAIALRTNLCPNPSAESGITGYSAVAGTGGTAAVTQSTVGAMQLLGSYYARVAWTIATGAVSGGVQYAGAAGSGVAVSPNLPYAFSWYIKPSKNQRLQLSVEWRTSGGAVISTSTAPAFVAWNFAYTRVQLVATAPATAAFAIVRVLAVTGTGSSNWAAGDYLAADGLLIEQTTRVLDYFDLNWRTFGTVTALGDGSQVLYDTVATVRANLAGNPSSEPAGGAIPYVGSVGAAGASVAVSTTRALFGTRSFQAARVPGAGSSGLVWNAVGDAFQPGDTYTFSAYVWSPIARSLASWGETTLLDRTTDGMAALGPGSPGSGAGLPITPGEWTRVSWVMTVPAGPGGMPASAISLGFFFGDDLPDPIWLDGVMVERGSELLPYFDGNSPSDGLETHAWSLFPTTGVPQTDQGTARRVAPHPADLTAVLGAEYWQYATGGVGVTGTIRRSSAASSGISWGSTVVPAGTYTAIVEVRAIDAVSITALGDQTSALAAGATHEFRRDVTTGSAGAYLASVLQNDTTPKRWVVTHCALVPGAGYTGPYFDGSMAAPDADSRYTWVGAADASETVHELLPAPDLTATVDTDSKGVQLLAEGIALVQKITIQRVVAGYPAAQPRGAREATAIGGTLLTFDNEAPLGVPISYQARGHFTDGSVSGWSDPVTVAIPIEANEVWLKDVGQPLRSTRVILRNLGGKQPKSRSEIHEIQDSEHPVVVSGTRLAPNENITLGTTTDTQRTKLEALLKTGQVVLLQCPPGWGRQDTYVAIGDYRELRLVQYGPRPERNWEATIQEVAEPSSERTGLPSSSYRAVSEDFASYRAMMANRSSYLGVLANSAEIQ